MKALIHDDFLLQTEEAKELFHGYAEKQPIIDYHCHLDSSLIASDHQFNNLWEVWLQGDHYKWRAMRTNGIAEYYCTGAAEPFSKFEKWAETVPATIRNPLYHWTALELARYFDIYEPLNPASAKKIYSHCNELLLTPEYTCKNLLRRMKVEVVGTTDDPVDSLDAHRQLKEDGFEVQVRPTFRPDKACSVKSVESYHAYLDLLGAVADLEIRTYTDLLDALKRRHDYFHEQGCRLSDHGISAFYAVEESGFSASRCFERLRSGKLPTKTELIQFEAGLLLELARMDHQKGWVQQFHYGALRNNNTRMFREIGPDTGFDSIGDEPIGAGLSEFLDRLDQNKELTKTILYNLNPRDNHLIAAMIGNFQDGSIPGKIQFGSGWWFLDQMDGMVQQLNALSNLGLLSRFVGMLTDSRSFLSYPRHEYFRRILCNLLGSEMKQGILPNDMHLIGSLVKDISYGNAREYFGFYSGTSSASSIITL